MTATKDLRLDYPNLDAAIIEKLEMLTEGPSLDLASIPLPAARALATEYLTAMGNSWASPDVESGVHDLQDGLQVHVFRPQHELADTAPLLIWLHGGGWVFGSPALHAPLGREIATRAGCIVADIGYPLAPEHSCQQMLDSCSGTIRHCAALFGSKLEGAGQRKLLIGGESSGAHLALLTAAAPGMPDIAGVIAVNPIVDLRSDRNLYPSRHRFDDSRIMQSWGEFRWFIDTLVGESDDVARYSPIMSVATRNLPRTHLLVGEYDVLRDEGQAFCTACPGSTIEVISGGIHNSLEFGGETASGQAFFAGIAAAITRLANEAS